MEHAITEAKEKLEAKTKPKTKPTKKPFIESLVGKPVQVLDDYAEPMYDKITLVELDDKRRVYVFKKETGNMFAVQYDKIGGIGIRSE